MTSPLPNLAEFADELVIGLLDPADQARAERLEREDQTFAQLVNAARKRFSALDQTAPQQDLPSGMWQRVLDAIEQEAPEAQAAASEPVDLDKARQRRSSSALFWTTATSLAASLFLAVALGWNLMSTVEPKVVAILLSDAGQPVAMIEGAADNTTLVTMLGETTVPGDRVMQLWTKPDPAGPPVSLGVFDKPRKTVLSVSGLPSPSTDQLYEITFEQPGGSPTGLPTGTILGKGFSSQPH
ncbi:anti-sigma factor [Roseibium suaedae]|uniref:Anti-sigma-K factor RskA n=1 Tax=Roseibium suaedae TaxID=735517 RepID=A0A1M7BIT9_9HYPH|nr:anti-sigma factor [Roseibium suaedae]SHL54519.1 Anti-sigma-K factor RskA [Roseibium suaedae]